MYRHFSVVIATLQFFQHPENIKNSIFPITLSQQKCHIFKCLEFSKTFFGWKMSNVAIVVENLKCTDILILQIAMLQLCPHPAHVKISIFPITLSQQKCYIFQKYLTNFLELFFGWKTRNVAIVVENLKCTDVLVLQ